MSFFQFRYLFVQFHGCFILHYTSSSKYVRRDVLCILYFASFSIRLAMMDNICQTKRRRIQPKERANFLSRITFFYTSGIFLRAYNKGRLEENDLYDVPKNCQAENLGKELENHIRRDFTEHGAISIYRILWSCYGIEYLFIGIIQLIIRTTVIVTIPMILSKLVLYFQRTQTDLTKKDAIILGILLILLNLINVTYLHNYLLRLAEIGIRVKAAFSSVIYRKCLRLTLSGLSDITVGKIVTLITKDVTTLESMAFYANDTWIGVTQGILVCCLIYYKMGSVAFLGIGFLILALPVQIYIGKVMSNLKEYSSKNTDERLQTTKEIIAAIQFIKMYTWEEFFENEISQARKREMTSILKIFLANTLSMLFGALTSKIAFYVLMMTCIWSGHFLTADLIYYVLTLFLRIRHALNTSIPKGVLMAGELAAAGTRIESLLNGDEIQEISVTRNTNQNEPKLKLKNLTLASEKGIILKNTTLSIRSGLTVITGPLGCGKTSLLKSFLGEDTIAEGELNVFGSISYASQEPWIFPASLKRNILFGEYFDSSRYEKVLEVCALNSDLEQFQFGDEMRITDNGTNLSKGQKARVNLARAVYKKADIYLLDDCLTSLDASVRRFVFENCIKTFLRDKICVLVSQQLDNLGKGDMTFFMENGMIKLKSDIATEDEIESSSCTHVAAIKGEINNNVVEDTDYQETTKLLESNQSKPNEGIYIEQNKSGEVSWNIYQKYIQYGGGYVIFFFVLACFISKHFSNSYAEKILSSWINEMNEVSHKNTTAFSLVYSILILATVITAFLTSWAFFSFTRRASLGLHSSMANSIIHASMRFFDQSLVGSILNRFSKDLTVIDEEFPIIVFEFLEIFFGFVGMVALISSVSIIFLVPTVIILMALILLKIFYMPTGRSLQRLNLSTRSPVIGYLNASLEGLVTIRAFNAQRVSSQEFDRHLDLYTSANFSSKCCQRAFGYAMDICCTMFIALIVAIFLSIDTGISVGDFGLGITQAFTLTGIVQYGMRQWAELQTKVTSVERVMEYTRTEREEKLGGTFPGANWPKECSIDYENVNLSYSDGPMRTLKNIDLSIRDKEKIGIVGRTGAGKSSIISALFRLYSYEGTIRVDKVDIQTIPLTFFRSKIAVIPQDPTLFTGTIRTNIDPLEKHTDEAIWRAIETVRLKSLVPSLTVTISASGCEYSAGQKQLLCLARALVSENRMIVMDEATSNMDDETSAIINDVIVKDFRECTVVVIAHRMQSVLGCDRVMVVQAGEVVQFDSPKGLAANKDGLFYELLEKAGLGDMFE